MGPKALVAEKDMEASQYFPEKRYDMISDNFGYYLNYQVDFKNLSQDEDQTEFYDVRTFSLMYDLANTDSEEY